jgi:hypothetical protein
LLRLISIVAVLAASISLRWQSEPQKPGAASSHIADSRLGLDGPVRAEDVYKSIETFKGKPATQVLLAMNSIRGTLGVSCTYCHTQYEWDKNDKPAKEKTRKMFKMLGYIEGKYLITRIK